MADVRFDLGAAALCDYDVILLGTHDLSSRRHVNRWVHRLPGRTRAIVEGGLDEFSWQVQTILVGESPCYTCALSPAHRDGDVLIGCNGLPQEVDATPAATNGPDGMTVAGLMVREMALVLTGLPPFYATHRLRMFGETGEVRMLRRRWRDSCDEHRRTTAERIVTLPYGPAAAVAAVRGRAAAALSLDRERVALASPIAIVARLRCRCGAVQRVGRPHGVPLAPRCSGCGVAAADGFALDLVSELRDHEPRVAGDQPALLTDFGIPARQPLELYVDGALHGYVLPSQG